MILNAIYLIWAGILIGVSFIATIAKFYAQNMTLPLALGVGKVTFHTQIIIDLILITICGLLILFYYLKNKNINNLNFLIFLIILFIILFEKFYMLPVMDIRLDARVTGNTVNESWHHIGYIIMETAKVILLVFAGGKRIKNG